MEVGVHQGSVLSSILFIIVLQDMTKEFELLLADDLFLITEYLLELQRKVQVWKQEQEFKGLIVNLAKTKVLASREANKLLIPSGKNGSTQYVTKNKVHVQILK